MLRSFVLHGIPRSFGVLCHLDPDLSWIHLCSASLVNNKYSIPQNCRYVQNFCQQSPAVLYTLFTLFTF